MNPTVDRMLALTADIAEELLLVKDAGSDTLPDDLKLKIISLAELAATTHAPEPLDDPSPSETEEVAEMTEGAQAMETEETMEDEAISEAEPSSGPTTESPVEEEVEAAMQEEEEEADPEDVPVADPDSEPIRHLDPKALFQAFSINDAFLFRREIFGGSKERFFESLDHIATLPDRPALRRYLEGNLGLDLDKYPGREFYQTLALFF